MDWLNFDPGILNDQFVGMFVGFLYFLAEASLRIISVFP